MYELAFGPEPFEGELAAPERRDLARSVVVALVRTGIRDVARLSNTAFHIHHPERDLTRRIDPAKEPDLARLWNELKQSVVGPALGGGGTRVLLVGDSHTNSAFGAELARLLEGAGATVVREAKDGSAVKYWLPRMPALLAQHAPTVVIVALGANMRDYASRGSISPLVAAVRAGAPSARLVWIGPPKHRDASADQAQKLDASIRSGLDGATAFVSSLPFTPAFRGANDGEHYAADLARTWARGVFGALGPIASQELELTFEPERFLDDIVDAARKVLTGDRDGTLAIVARWLVGDLIRAGERSPGELTDAAFAVLHPELGGRRLERSEAALIADYRRIQRDVVAPLLGGAPAPTTTGVPPLDGPREPAGYRVAGNGRGLARYSGDRLETRLRELMASGIVKDLSEADLDTFQRIANVETGGGTQALNTWDSAVVSIGFFQLTLKYGELQHLIASAAPAFARYGIELDPSAKYRIGNEVVTAIRGAELSQIRWGGWAERFYLAGLDPDVIAAEVAHGKTLLAKGLASAKAALGGQYTAFRRAYDGSLPLRGLYQEARNNHPAAAKAGIVAATRQAIAEDADPTRFYKLATVAMVDAFATVKGNRESGQRLVAKTACGLGTRKTEWPC